MISREREREILYMALSMARRIDEDSKTKKLGICLDGSSGSQVEVLGADGQSFGVIQDLGDGDDRAAATDFVSRVLSREVDNLRVYLTKDEWKAALKDAE